MIQYSKQTDERREAVRRHHLVPDAGPELDDVGLALPQHSTERAGDEEDARRRDDVAPDERGHLPLAHRLPRALLRNGRHLAHGLTTIFASISACPMPQNSKQRTE